jgi:hypothetical protein
MTIAGMLATQMVKTNSQHLVVTALKFMIAKFRY